MIFAPSISSDSRHLPLILLSGFLAACSSNGESGLPSPGAGEAVCDTTPVLLDLRRPGVPEPLASVPVEWPQGEVYASPYTYLLHVPENLPEAPVPLMVALHGLLGSGPQYAHQSDWARLADEQGFIVVFPTGPRKWDSTPSSVDVRFIREVVVQLRSERCIDPKRIWATGHSYGGYMTQRLACDAGDLFAAAAEVEGGDVEQPLIGGACDAGASGAAGFEPVPLAFWHGTADPLVSYAWSRQSLAKWIARYQCQTEPARRSETAYGALEIYGGCRRDEVRAREQATGQPFLLRYHSYEGHGHGYPDGCGGQGQMRAANCQADASTWPTAETQNREILEFLYRNPRATPAP